MLFLSEYLKGSFLQPHIWKYNVFSSGADGLLSDRAKETGLQRDQTELKHFPSSWRADLCTFTIKCTVQNFAILSWTHVLEASRLPCEELDLTELPALHWHPWGSHTLGIPLEMLSIISGTSSFDCLTIALESQVVPFHSLQFPGYFLKLWLLPCAWDAKLSDTAPATASPCLAEEPVPHQAVAVGHHGVPLELGSVLFLLVPYLMKLTTWHLYLLNNMYHHATASPSPSYVLRGRYNQEEERKKKKRKSIKWYSIVKIPELWRRKDLLLLSMKRQILSENTDNKNSSIHEQKPGFAGVIYLVSYSKGAKLRQKYQMHNTSTHK